MFVKVCRSQNDKTTDQKSRSNKQLVVCGKFSIIFLFNLTLSVVNSLPTLHLTLTEKISFKKLQKGNNLNSSRSLVHCSYWSYPEKSVFRYFTFLLSTGNAIIWNATSLSWQRFWPLNNTRSEINTGLIYNSSDWGWRSLAHIKNCLSKWVQTVSD